MHFLNKLPVSGIHRQTLGLFPLHFAGRVIGPDTRGRTCRGSDVLVSCEATGALTAQIDLNSQFLDASRIEKIAREYVSTFSHHRDISYGIGERAYAPILEEALDDLDAPPSAVLVPVGAGVLFEECVEVIEARGLNTIVVGISVTEPQSVGDKIYGFYSPYFDDLRLRDTSSHARFRRHPVLRVADDEILLAVQWCSERGIDAEPSAAAGLVPFLMNNPAIPAGDVLWINTGNGIIVNGRHSSDERGVNS